MGIPVLLPRQEFDWVNDQVLAPDRPRDVKVKVGKGRAVDAADLPRVTLTRPRLQQDPVSGTAATGFAANRSKVELRKLVVFAVARKGSKVVAAGRAQINRLLPGKRAPVLRVLHRQPARRAGLGIGAADTTQVGDG